MDPTTLGSYYLLDTKRKENVINSSLSWLRITWLGHLLLSPSTRREIQNYNPLYFEFSIWMSKCLPEGFPQDIVFLSFWVWGYFDCEVDTIMANVHIHNKRNSKQIISIDTEQSVTKEGHSCHQLFHMKMFVWWRHWSTRLRSKIPVIAVWYL